MWRLYGQAGIRLIQNYARSHSVAHTHSLRWNIESVQLAAAASAATTAATVHTTYSPYTLTRSQHTVVYVPFELNRIHARSE